VQFVCLGFVLLILKSSMGNNVDHFGFTNNSELCFSRFSLYFCYLEHCHFQDLSDLFSLPCFVVKFDNGIPLRLFLLLSGNIELYPGLSILHPCSVCTLKVADNHKALCCDMCDQWVHVACDPGTDESTYDDMVAHLTSAMWYCFCCSHFKPSVDMSNSSVL